LVETSANYVVATFTTSDGYRCHYRRYVPSAEGAIIPRAHVVCIHGIQSHAGWYEHSCTRLSQAGYLVSFLDRRGAGLNEQDRGDTPSYRRLVDDIAEFLEIDGDGESAKEKGVVTLPLSRSPTLPLSLPPTLPLSQSQISSSSSRLPVFLLAISWGGKLAVAFQGLHPGQVDGLVLLCPGFYPRVGPSLGERLQIAWSRLVSPRRLFPVPLQDAELFTATPRWQQFIRDDPLSLRLATARFFAASVFLDRALRSLPKQVHVPVLLLLAGKDRVIDNHLTRCYVDQFATGDKEIIEYPEAAHTLEFEADPTPFVEALQGWLDRHCPVS
jgi:alpha-beta hydrolase superfamily lysophospholipase